MIDAAQLARVLGQPGPTDEQAAVIEAPLASALVVAGAGSGKTETMAGRVLYLVANELVRPEEILGLTFTRKAAAALATRIRRRLRMWSTVTGVEVGTHPRPGAVLTGEPDVSTYHAFGGRVIAEFGALSGLDPRARVLTPTAVWQLARRVVSRWDGDLGTDLRPEQVTEHVLALAGGLADHLRRPDELEKVLRAVLHAIRHAPVGPRQTGEVRSDLVDHLRRLGDRISILPLVQAFAAAKQAAGVIDFADQMQIAAELSGRSPRVGAALRERYRIVLLDEYQDTGHAQRMLLTSLFGGANSSNDHRSGWTARGHPVMAVGDPVQSIYSWRGASAANLPRFTTDFPAADGSPAPTLTLSTSFRNAAGVLAVANAMSEPLRRDPVPVLPLRPQDGAPVGDVRLALFDTVDSEDRWLAERLADAWREAAAAGRPPPRTAVLLRRRRDMDGLAVALRAVGLPVEVVGLGGLLLEPEVADLVAMLRLVVDPGAGAATLRVLTGARWRLGLADLAVLQRRARQLAGRPADESGTAGGLSASLSATDLDLASLADAIDDPGPGDELSPVGSARLRRLRHELGRLRSRLAQPLPDLLADVERSMGLDIEVAVHSESGRAHLDAFADVVTDVAATGAGPLELLDYLATAQEREDGLAPGEVEVSGERVQVLTVHAAKGLEWEVVAVPHLSTSVFPHQQGRSWLSDSTQLPPELRGDRAELPSLTLPPPGEDQSEVSKALRSHTDALKAAAAVEERRLLYVALTRAERLLLLSAHHFGRTAARPHGPGEFLTEISALDPPPPGMHIDMWADAPAADAANPLTSTPREAVWPVDPLGHRRTGLERAAGLVMEAMIESPAPEDHPADLAGPAVAVTDPAGPAVAATDPGDRFGWARDVDVLLAERSRAAEQVIEVDVPPGLTVTELVELAADPQGLARRWRRPVPVPPHRAARRGTAFHAWVEHHYSARPLLDIGELPGASDSVVPADVRLVELTEHFLASEWAGRVPSELEMPFSTTVAGVPVRGRIDAVFADADGGFTVIDWKTGPPSSGPAAATGAVQLAVYRLAAARILRVEVERVRALFVHVLEGVSVEPVDLLDRSGLESLISGATAPATVITTDSAAAGATAAGAVRAVGRR